MMSRITIWLHWHPNVSIRKICSHYWMQCSPLQDIREEQLEKIIPYAQALQYWAERSNWPMLGQPCLLARCILELRETMEQYVFFSDDTVLDGVTPLKGFFKDQIKITIPGESLPTFTDVPMEEVAMEKLSPVGGL